MLARLGFVTRLGLQIQDRQQTCGGYPGLVYFRGLVSTPDPSKLVEVSIPPTSRLEIRRSAAPQVMRDRATHPCASGKWIPFTYTDLELLPGVSDRFVHRCVVSVAGAPVWVTFSCPRNSAIALLVRVFRELRHDVDGVSVPLVVNPDAWAMARSYLAYFLPSFLDPHREVMPFFDWLNSMESRRRPPLLAAFQLYAKTGWLQKYGKISAFLKVENGPAFSKDQQGLLPQSYSAPRLIQAPHDVSHVIAGPRIKPCLKLLKKDWTYSAPIFYASTTPVELHKWLQYGVARHNKDDLTVFWSDFTMYDSSFRSVHWDFVESLYGSLRCDFAFREVLRHWRQPRGTCGDFRYQTGDMNASGRDDTAFANGVLNGFASFLSAAAAWYGVELLSLTARQVRSFAKFCKLAVCGDDSLGFLPALSLEHRLRFIRAFRKNLATFGFKAKAFASSRLVDAVFLAHRPTLVGKNWFWGKTVGRAIFKLGWQSEIKGDVMAWLTGVCDMHQLCSKHVPVLYDFADAWSVARGGFKRTPVVFDQHRPWDWMTAGLDVPNYDQSTLLSLAEAYSVVRDAATGSFEPCDVALTVDDILSCIAYVRHMLRFGAPVCLDHWVLRHMVWVDEQ